MKYALVKSFITAGLALTVAGCNPSTSTDPNLLATVGKQRLTRSDVDQAVGRGLSPEDSTRMARAYIRSWIEARVMGEIAQKNIPDMSRIERMVDDYRNELIAWEYRRLMFQQHGDIIFPQDSIQAYYDAHRSEFILERPLVKGVYIKIADNSPALSRIRKLYRSTKPEDVDRLEKQEARTALHYDYFRDRWVDWEQIETRMPYPFGNDDNAFLASHTHAEVSSNGVTHLLAITEYLRAGTTMPLEHAEKQIRGILFNRYRAEYDNQLRMELYNQGLSDGTITILTPLD